MSVYFPGVCFCTHTIHVWYIYLHQPNVGKYTIHGWYGVVPWKNLALENDMRMMNIPSGTRPLMKHPTRPAHKKGTAMTDIHPWVVKQSYGFKISDSDTEHDGLWQKRVSFQVYEFFWVNSQKRDHNQTGPKKTTDIRKRYSTSPKSKGCMGTTNHLIRKRNSSSNCWVPSFQGVAVVFFK